MYLDRQADNWDHTALIIASWSSKQIDPNRLNPYRRRQQRSKGMLPAELHALAAALDKRNAEYFG